MELELPEGSSEEEANAKATEKDGFSEYVQATANAPVFEPEIEESEDDGNGSPSPIVLKDNRKMESRNTPQISPKDTPIVHVQPVQNNHLKIEVKDEDFGEFVD